MRTLALHDKDTRKLTMNKYYRIMKDEIERKNKIVLFNM